MDSRFYDFTDTGGGGGVGGAGGGVGCCKGLSFLIKLCWKRLLRFTTVKGGGGGRGGGGVYELILHILREDVCMRKERT